MLVPSNVFALSSKFKWKHQMDECIKIKINIPLYDSNANLNQIFLLRVNISKDKLQKLNLLFA